MRTSEKAVWITLGAFMLNVAFFRNEHPGALTVACLTCFACIIWNLADEANLREE